MAFLYTGTWHLIYLNINISTSIASAIPVYCPNVSNSDVFLIYSSNEVRVFLNQIDQLPQIRIINHQKGAQVRTEEYVIYRMGQHVVVSGILNHMQGSREVPGRIHRMTSWYSSRDHVKVATRFQSHDHKQHRGSIEYVGGEGWVYGTPK